MVKEDLKNMKLKIVFFGIWLAGNSILITKYFWDAMSINCEPCPPGTPCGPCQTDYMKYFPYFIAGWNLISPVFWFSARKWLIRKSSKPDFENIIDRG